MKRRSLFRNPSEHVLFDGRALVGLIIPFILGYVMSLLVGMLDTAMVSTVGEAAVSGVSLVDSLMQLAVFVFLAFANGGAVVAGQYLGNKDSEHARESTGQLLLVAGIVSAGIMTVLFLCRNTLVLRFFGNITAEVNQEAQIYLLITLFSLPAIALYEAGLATFRAMGHAKITMYLSVVMNLINVVGNALLILVFHMGTAGVAWPTLISRWAGAILALGLLLDRRRSIFLDLKRRIHINLPLIGKILRVGLPNGVENGIFQFGKVLILGLVTDFGTAAIAANAVATILTNIVSVPGWGINQADMTVVSRCVGAEDYEQAKYYNRLMQLITLVVVFVWACLIFVSLPLILSFFRLSPAALRLARTMTLIHMVGSFLIWPSAFIVPTSMRAAGDAAVPMVISIFSMWVFRVGFAWILCRYTALGAPAVWVAMVTDWAFRAIAYHLCWRSGRWMTKRII